MKNPFKSDTEIQQVCIKQKTNRWDDEKLPVMGLYVDSEESAESWGIDPKQQCRDRKTGKYLQFVARSSCIPVKIYRGIDSQDIDIGIVQSETERQAQALIEVQKSKSGSLLWLGICLAMLTLTVCIIVLVVMV